MRFGFADENYPSWGGVVTRDAKTNEYQMFVSYLVNKCDLYSYGTNSAVMRATSKMPEGPYKFHSTVLGPFHHGTVITENEDHVYLFADGDRDLPKKYTHDCTTQRESTSFTKRTIVSPSVKTGDYAYGKGPHDYISVTTLDKRNDYKIKIANQVILKTNLQAGIMCNKTNPSPVLLGRGEQEQTVMVLRGTYCDPFGKEPKCPANSNCEHQHAFFAKSIPGTTAGNGLTFEPESQWKHIKQLTASEDPFLWVDAKGRYHVLSHSKLACNGRKGEDTCVLMASSLDGTEWTSASKPAFEGKVEIRNKSSSSAPPSSQKMKLFQRAKIFFEGETPLFLIAGVRRTARAPTQTLMIPFNVPQNARFKAPGRGSESTPSPSKKPQQPQQQQGRRTSSPSSSSSTDEEEEDYDDEGKEDYDEYAEEEEESEGKTPAPAATTTTTPKKRGESSKTPKKQEGNAFQVLAVIILGALLVPLIFTSLYACVRAITRLRSGYDVLAQS